ncbi:hypothetical protein JCM31826_08250 [Thermaurantimonas aggregans]|uniref:Glycosyltransferase 2-like domain-containing protein n=1 Tax=Thermaurantimonas aggregans TaxID=2173829 RepID=A0A401XK24_9FLAO|nr:glycosyltransferase [Thermaurantimonas aggregans]GCD77343.1 hypothetical protein JCM31826_08250 [Thermaurantimonas aggregans]
MTFSLVITTYNRPLEVLSLVKQAIECQPIPDEVIVVDSSDEVHRELSEMKGVCYIHSSHKNQPYQRLLGATAANSDIVVLLDDDLKILRKEIFQLILEPFQLKGVVGSAVAFRYEDDNEMSLALPRNKLLKWFWQFTGVPFPAEGEVSRLGVVGCKPKQPGFSETFNGANMAFYRSLFVNIIPDDLLSLTERKLSMGEDKVISMKAVKEGKLYFNPEIGLEHPKNKSTYFQNERLFNIKVTYSRLYLSKIYAEVFDKPFWQEILIFQWFTFWRLTIAGFSWLFRPSKTRKQKFIGILEGWRLAFTLPLKAEKLTPGLHWPTEIQKDLERSGIRL